MKKILYIFMLLLFSIIINAQNEYIVNTYQDTTQRDPQIAKDGNGNYVVVWTTLNKISKASQDEIAIQRFNNNDEMIGVEELVNTTTDFNQERPAVAMNDTGMYIVVWASYTDFNSIYDIRARIYKNNQPVGNDFLVNTFTTGTQTNPDVAIDNNGSFVITWDSWYQDGSNKGVYAQMFDNNGNKIGNEFLVNSTTINSQQRPVIKKFENCNFIIVWESWNQDSATPSGYGIYGKIYSASGQVIKDEFGLNTYTNDYQWFGDLAVYPDNSFIAVWCSWKQDGYDGGIYMQKFNSAGEKIGGEILVNKTIVNYQWLPKIGLLDNGNIAVVWSSWLQDGDREGVFSSIFDSNLSKLSFECIVNQYTTSYQWEPVFIPKADNTILVAYSSWGISGKCYEIVARKFTPTFPQAIIQPTSYNLINGANTSKILVHVIDSTQVTNNNYEITFTETGTKKVKADILNTTTNTPVVQNYPIEGGEGVFYLTPTFEGIAVQFIPEFDFALDLDNSVFTNTSGTNVIFQVLAASGNVKLAPIDCILNWGKTDTLANGAYAFPLDTAYGSSGTKDILLPFIVNDVTNNEKMRIYISEPAATKNKRWDPGESIILLTPVQYQTSFPNFHAQIKTTKPVGNIIYPNLGDTQAILTTRPIKTGDKFTFTSNKNLFVTSVLSDKISPDKFELEQNYPNPFNPSTTISFTIPVEGKVKLSVYNILGERVTTLVDDFKLKGNYKVQFNAHNLASGIYIYSLQFNNKIINKKMVMVK